MLPVPREAAQRPLRAQRLAPGSPALPIQPPGSIRAARSLHLIALPDRPATAEPVHLSVLNPPSEATGYRWEAIGDENRSSGPIGPPNDGAVRNSRGSPRNGPDNRPRLQPPSHAQPCGTSSPSEADTTRHSPRPASHVGRPGAGPARAAASAGGTTLPVTAVPGSGPETWVRFLNAAHSRSSWLAIRHRPVSAAARLRQRRSPGPLDLAVVR